MPIVTSVPKWIKWRVVGDISVTLVAVGLFVVSKPDVFVAALLPVGLAAPAFQVKVLPFAIVATNT